MHRALLVVVGGAFLLEATLPRGRHETPRTPAPLATLSPRPDAAAGVSPSPFVITPEPRLIAGREPLDDGRLIVERAREEVTRGVRYDASYRRIDYPGGDVPRDVGACSDLVVRALRAIDVDLQELVHEDVLDHPELYPVWEIGDASVDHRRVPTLFAYFDHEAARGEADWSEERRTTAIERLDVDPRAGDLRPGDIVFYARAPCAPRRPCLPRHVALVSDRRGPRGLPLVLENGGPRAVESDALDQPVLVARFRVARPHLVAGAPPALRRSGP